MKNPLSDVYPAVTNCGNLMNDDDLIDMVRKHMGDDVGLVLAHRLEIARPRPQLDQKIREAWESLSDACHDLEIVVDHLDEFD